jgi:hypothetical protein
MDTTPWASHHGLWGLDGQSGEPGDPADEDFEHGGAVEGAEPKVDQPGFLA